MAHGSVDRYCAFCGSEMVERHLDGRVRSACPACGHVAYEKLKVGAGVLIQREGQLLLVRRAADCDAFPRAWGLPAGYCEVDEHPRVTAAREAKEETGLDVEVGCLVGVYYFDDDPRGNGVLLVYAGSVTAGQMNGDSPEVAAIGLFEADQLPEPLSGGGHDQGIAAWRRRTRARWQPGLPPRFCPHCAARLRERPAFGRVRPVCSMCGFTHFVDPKVGVSALVEQDGKVLLVQRAIEPGLGRWALPSGFVELNEVPEIAAARECEEETGLRVDGLVLLEVTHYSDDFRGAGLNLTYRARVAGGVLQPGDDAQDARFFTSEELPPGHQVAFASHRAALEGWQARVNNASWRDASDERESGPHGPCAML